MRLAAEFAANTLGQIFYFGFQVLALMRGKVTEYQEIKAVRKAARCYARARSLERAQKLREAYEMANQAFSSLRAADPKATYPEMGYLVAMRLDSLARRLGIPGGARQEIKEVIEVLKPIQADLNYPSSYAVAIADLESRLSDGTDRSTDTPTTRIRRGGVSIVNKSKCIVYCRPESSVEVIALEPGGSYGGVQVGVAVPETHPGEVYKSLNYIDITINERGVLLTTGGVIFKAINRIQGGGWKDKAWLAARHAEGDHGWDLLFAASDKEPECGTTIR
jgi:hypothetical protein